jgi:3-mercaptopyruvate sulfurtransferase SseA
VKRATASKKWLFVSAALCAGIFLFYPIVRADSSKYPEFAQQKLPDNVTPAFISVDQLVKDITAAEKPVIIDVRSAEEYREVHIMGAVSAPLADFSAHLKEVPRDRPVVLY